MTGYGAPPSPPQSAARSAESGRPVASPPPVFDLIGAFLGLVVFVLGFLPWYRVAGADIKGYYVGSAAPAVIGLSVLAAAVAATSLLEKPAKSTVVPLGASVAAFLIVFGMLVAKGDNIDVQVGLIVTLILAILQVGAFTLGWLQANGRIMVPKPHAASPWGSPQYGYQSGPQPSYPPPAGYGQAPYGQPPSYGQAPFGQPPSYGQAASAWTPPPGYRPPQGPGSGPQGQQPGQQPGQHQSPPQSGQQPGQPPPSQPTSQRPGSYGQSAQGGQPQYPSNPAYGQPSTYAPPAPPPAQSGTSYGQTQVFPPSRPQQPGPQQPGPQQPGPQQPGPQQPGPQPNQSAGPDAGERPGERPGSSS